MSMVYCAASRTVRSSKIRFQGRLLQPRRMIGFQDEDISDQGEICRGVSRRADKTPSASEPRSSSARSNIPLLRRKRSAFSWFPPCLQRA